MYVKLGIVVVAITGIIGSYMYVKSLQANLAQAEVELSGTRVALEHQELTIEQQQRDLETQNRLSRERTEYIEKLQRDHEALVTRFNKNGRDLGVLAERATDRVETIINKASNDAIRCMEIASGSPLTDEERNATIKSETNQECPSIHPNYGVD